MLASGIWKHGFELFYLHTSNIEVKQHVILVQYITFDRLDFIYIQ